MRWGEVDFSGVLVGAYLTPLTLLWSGLAAGVGRWHLRYRLPVVTPSPLPRVSICVPARNEAHQIADCVRAALAQDHTDLEVLVVDDQSTDNTGEIATNAAAGDSRFRLLSGTPPPPGWAGKQWACNRASSVASGEILLFVDADVTLSPSAVRRAAEVLRARRVGLLSLFGTWRLESFWEKVAIPVIGWFIRGAINIDAVNTPGTDLAFANGQFLMVSRAAYDEVGGHGAVRDTVLDDVRLAQAFKRRGQPLGLFWAPELFSVRLYRSLGEIVRGYTKNFYEGMERRPLLAMGALLFVLVGSVLPWLMLVASFERPATVLLGDGSEWMWRSWIAVVCLLPLLVRYRLERADGRPGGMALTDPLGNLVLAWVLLRSVFSVRTQWKGRTFHDGRIVANDRPS